MLPPLSFKFLYVFKRFPFDFFFVDFFHGFLFRPPNKINKILIKTKNFKKIYEKKSLILCAIKTSVSQLYLFGTSVFDMDAVVCLESDWQTDFDAVFNVNKKIFVLFSKTSVDFL